MESEWGAGYMRVKRDSGTRTPADQQQGADGDPMISGEGRGMMRATLSPADGVTPAAPTPGTDSSFLISEEATLLMRRTRKQIPDAKHI